MSLFYHFYLPDNKFKLIFSVKQQGEGGRERTVR